MQVWKLGLQGDGAQGADVLQRLLHRRTRGIQGHEQLPGLFQFPCKELLITPGCGGGGQLEVQCQAFPQIGLKGQGGAVRMGDDHSTSP